MLSLSACVLYMNIVGVFYVLVKPDIHIFRVALSALCVRVDVYRRTFGKHCSGVFSAVAGNYGAVFSVKR